VDLSAALFPVVGLHPVASVVVIIRVLVVPSARKHDDVFVSGGPPDGLRELAGVRLVDDEVDGPRRAVAEVVQQLFHRVLFFLARLGRQQAGETGGYLAFLLQY